MSTIPAVKRSDVLLRSVSLNTISIFCLQLYTLDSFQAIVPGYSLICIIPIYSILSGSEEILTPHVLLSYPGGPRPLPV